MILLTTWPDPTLGAGCREKLPEQGKGVLLPTVGLSGTALQKEGPESGSSRSKGDAGAWRGHTNHPGCQAEAAEQGDLLVLLGNGRRGDRLCHLTRAQTHLSRVI